MEDFDTLYNAYYYKIVAFFRNTVYYNKDISEDLAQETFNKIWRSYYRKGKVLDNPIALPYKIANSIRAEHYRKSKYRETGIDKLNISYNQDFYMKYHILNILDKLPKDEKEIFDMYLSGYNSYEISEMKNRNASTVRTIISRCKKIIKKYY